MPAKLIDDYQPDKLTDRLIRELCPPVKGNRVKYDSEIKGFGIRVTSAGARSFVLNYRVHGIERRITIGSSAAWTEAQAREEAKRLRRLIDQGVDPLAKREEERAAPTVRELSNRFLDKHARRKRPSYLVNNTLIVNRWILPAIGNMKVADVRPSHIQKLHAKVTEAGSPIMANRVIACLSKMFSLSIGWEMRGDNPCRHAVDRNTEIRRQAYLKHEEIGRLTEALKKLPSQPAADCIRLIGLTGCRRGEAMAARVDQIDLDARIWRKPASSTKQNKPHETHLSAPALELLARLVREAKQAGRQYLFASRDGKGHLTDLKRSWVSLCKSAGISGVRLHDLRHTFASIAVSRGASLPLIGALLGHSSPATTARYAHLYDDPQRALAESIAAVITGGESGEVVPIGRARR